MSGKIQYTAELIPYAEALSHFENEASLLDALKMARIQAYGKIQHHVDLPDILSSLTLIYFETWRDCAFDGVELSGVSIDDNGCDNPYFIRDIYIDKTSIDSMRRLPKSGRGVQPKYDWDSFWCAVAYHLYAHEELDEPIPNSLRDWARNAKSIYSYIWNGSETPADTTLEDKLRPLFDSINSASTTPIEAAAKRFK